VGYLVLRSSAQAVVDVSFRAMTIKISQFFDVFHVDVATQGITSRTRRERLRFSSFKSSSVKVVAAGRFLLSYVLLLGSGSWKTLQRDGKMAHFFHLGFPDLFRFVMLSSFLCGVCITSFSL